MPLFALIIAATAMATAAPELSDRIQITEVVGAPDVKVIRAVGKKEETIHRGENLFVGDQLEVAPRQIVGLAAYDGSIWKLAPGTHFKAEARKPDKQNLAYWSFQVAKGAMWGQVQKKNDPKEAKEGFRLKVHTKTAALGIRGTEYLLSGDDEHPTIDVLEGRVWWGTDQGFAPGTYKEVAAGQHAEVAAGGRIEVTDSKGEKAKLVHDYGLFVEEETRKVHGSAQSCAERGLGWRNGDGTGGGECFHQAEDEEGK